MPFVVPDTLTKLREMEKRLGDNNQTLVTAAREDARDILGLSTDEWARYWEAAESGDRDTPELQDWASFWDAVALGDANVAERFGDLDFELRVMMAQDAAGVDCDTPVCEMCAQANEVVIATTRVPEPEGGAFSCAPGTFAAGIPLCNDCAEEWRNAP